MILTITEADIRVARGISLLDERMPSDWDTRISIENIDAYNWIDCPLGQLGFDPSTCKRRTWKEVGADLGLNVTYGHDGDNAVWMYGFEAASQDYKGWTLRSLTPVQILNNSWQRAMHIRYEQAHTIAKATGTNT